MSHRFRFFAEGAVSPGARIALAEPDLSHARVLRLADGDEVELVDPSGSVWRAQVLGDHAVASECLAGFRAPAPIELIAGALVGGRFDELVDGAVQAGATWIVPYAPTRRDAERLAARRARLGRIARAAAKQSKRSVVPEVRPPIDRDTLLAGPPGIVLGVTASARLDLVVAGAPAASIAQPLRLLVGPAEGLEGTLVAALIERGWRLARLGPTVLRAEIAATVAVAVAAMHATAADVASAG